MLTIIKKIKKGLLFTATLFTLGSSCGKDDSSKPCRGGRYSFVATSLFSPEKEIYNIGDTIYLSSSIPKILLNSVSNEQIDYSNSVGILGDLGIGYLDTISRQPLPAMDSFNLLNVTGEFVSRINNNKQGTNFKYFETSNSYEFKGAFICKKKGIYSFGVADLGSRGLNGKDCTNAGFFMTVSNINKHLYLHQYALNVNPNDPELQRSSYDFRVQ